MTSWSRFSRFFFWKIGGAEKKNRMFDRKLENCYKNITNVVQTLD